MLGSVVAHQVQIGVGEVGLETNSLWHPDFFQQVQNVFPRVHTCPADFAFGCQSFAMVLGDFCGGFVRYWQFFGRVGFRILAPLIVTPNSRPNQSESHHTFGLRAR